MRGRQTWFWATVVLVGGCLLAGGGCPTLPSIDLRPNTAPRADAGAPQQVMVGQTVYLNGLNSSDADGDTLTYLWTQSQGPQTVFLQNVSSGVASFVPPAEGTYIFTLTVNDGKASDEDTVKVEVVRQLPSKKVRLDVEVVGQGAVEPGGGLFTLNSTVTLKATAFDGWCFDRWEGDLSETQSQVQVFLDRSKTVRAVFVRADHINYTLTVTIQGQGTVQPAGGSYAGGTNVQLTARPIAGWEFDEWQGDLTGQANPASIVMDADKVVTAIFSQSTPAGWTKLDVDGPPARSNFGMAYDRKRGVVMLYGGASPPSTTHSELWEFDGNRWSLRSTNGPALNSHGVAFDEGRRVLVLFGGQGPETPPGGSGETWEWDGNQWQLRSTTGPNGRRNAEMVYDAARQVVVMFGGWSNGVLGDTWEWDGNAWSLRSIAGPPPREHHRMVFDTKRSVTVLFGGQTDCSNIVYGDTWEWDGIGWHEIANGGPARSLHAMCFDANRGAAVLFGGIVDGGCSVPEFADALTWEWNDGRWQSSIIAGPSAHAWSRSVYDVHRGRVVLFGGYITALVNETWVLNSPPQESP